MCSCVRVVWECGVYVCVCAYILVAVCNVCAQDDISNVWVCSMCDSGIAYFSMSKNKWIPAAGLTD